MNLDQSVIDRVCPRKEQQDEAIKIIQEMGERGFTGKEITEYLKEVGYQSSRNRPFSRSWIYFVLKGYHVKRTTAAERVQSLASSSSVHLPPHMQAKRRVIK